MGTVEDLGNNGPRFEIGERVRIKPDKLEKYVKDVEGVEAEELHTWRQGWEEAKRKDSAHPEGRGEEGRSYEEEFIDGHPHPNAKFIGISNLGIVDKLPGGKRLKLALGPSFKKSVWVDTDDVEDVSRGTWRHPREKEQKGAPEQNVSGKAEEGSNPINGSSGFQEVLGRGGHEGENNNEPKGAPAEKERDEK